MHCSIFSSFNNIIYLYIIVSLVFSEHDLLPSCHFPGLVAHPSATVEVSEGGSYAGLEEQSFEEFSAAFCGQTVSSPSS